MALPSLQTNNQKKGGDFMSAWALAVQDNFLIRTVNRQDLLQFSCSGLTREGSYIYLWPDGRSLNFIFSPYFSIICPIFLFKNLLLHVSELCLIPFWQSSTNSLFLFFLTLDFGRHKLALRGLQRCWPLKLFLTPPCSVSDSITGHAGTELVSHSAAQHLQEGLCYNMNMMLKLKLRN